MDAKLTLEQRDDLENVEADVMRALKPVSPPPAFRARLRDGLRNAAQHQQEPPVRVHEPPRDQLQWSWLISAAALGSVIGLLLVLLRARLGHRSIE